MQGACTFRQAGQRRFPVRQIGAQGAAQRLGAIPQRLRQPLRGLARRRRQRDCRRAPGTQSDPLPQQQQAQYGGGLAGTGATAQDQQALAHGGGHGGALLLAALRIDADEQARQIGCDRAWIGI